MLLQHQLLELPEGPQVVVLADGLRRLFGALKTSGMPAAQRATDVVLESAWLPTMLLPAEQALWSTARLQALLRHRLNDLYADVWDPVDAWELQFDHRAGDGQAVGYGLAPSIKAAVLDACAATNVRPACVQPALAWQLRRIDPSVRRASAAWWLCVEQDRSIVCGLQRGRVAAMNAGAPPLRDEAHAQRLAAVEARRRGWPPAHEPASFAGWFAAADATASPPVAARPTQALA